MPMPMGPKPLTRQNLLEYALQRVSRVEVIDHEGRQFVSQRIPFTVVLQDADHTLKIFVGEDSISALMGDSDPPTFRPLP